jgi:hypothetical protein
MPLIKVAVAHNKMTKVRDRLMSEDCIGYIDCEFEFRTSDWDEYKKIALFSRGHITPAIRYPQIIRVPLDENNMCVVPPEVSAMGGKFSVSVYGERGGENISTDWLYFTAGQDSYIYSMGDESHTKGQWDMLYSAIDQKVDKTTTIAGIDLSDSIMKSELSDIFDLYIVNLECVNNIWSKDKSFIEIKDAIDNDKVVVGLYDGKQYFCINNDEQQIRFSNANTPRLTILTIDNNDAIMYEEIEYKKDDEITNEEMLNLWNTIMK